MTIQFLSGSPRLLRNLNEKAVLGRLLSEGALTRMELEAFTGLSKPAMSDMLRRLETAELIRRDGEKAGTYGPKAGLWALREDAAYVAGVDVTSHGIDIAIANLAGTILALATERHEPRERYDAGDRLLGVLDVAARQAGLAASDIDQLVVGLPGIVDAQTGHLRRGQQLTNWEGFDIVESLAAVLGHRRVMVENDVNLVALEEMTVGAAEGVNAFLLLWLGEGVGGALVQGGKLVRGSTGSAGEVSGVLVALDGPDGGAMLVPIEDALNSASLVALAQATGVDEIEPVPAMRFAAHNQSSAFLAAVGDRIAMGLSSAIGMLDPDMVVLAGPLGKAGGRPLAQAVITSLRRLRLAIPQIVPAAIDSHAVRSGAIQLALEHTRERVFTGGSAARGLP